MYYSLCTTRKRGSEKKQHRKSSYDAYTTIMCQYHTQLLEIEKLLNLNERSPAVSLSSCIPSPLTPPPASDSDGNTELEILLDLVLSMLDEANPPSQRKTCRRIGTLVCLCKESFWLNETVS